MSRRGRPSRLAIYDRFNRAVSDLYATVGGLPVPVEAEEIWQGIWHDETHHSTALEGNTLALREVRALLEEGRAVGEKELREYLEVQGYADAATWVYRHAYETAAAGVDGPAQLITVGELREIHVLAVGPAWSHFSPPGRAPAEGPGAYRRHDIEPFPSGMRPPPWPDVPSHVTDWIAEANAMLEAKSTARDDGGAHPIARLAGLHAHLERIHPFLDGNGRTGRLALNLMLVRLSYPPAVISKRDRPAYLRALERADGGDAGPLGELLARALIHSIDRFLLPSLAGPRRLIPLSALADADVSLIALRRAAERGRLRAQRRSDQWYSTKKWVDEYKASRRRGRSATPTELPSPPHRAPL
jgi:hypothetical protein